MVATEANKEAMTVATDDDRREQPRNMLFLLCLFRNSKKMSLTSDVTGTKISILSECTHNLTKPFSTAITTTTKTMSNDDGPTQDEPPPLTEHDDAKANLQQRVLSLPVHQWLETAQQSHGIAHHDYSQYHAYCTRRLSRIRHAKEVRKDLVHSSTYVSGSAGGGGGKQTRRHAYVPRNIVPALPITAITSDEQDGNDKDSAGTTAPAVLPKELHENVLWVLLVGAERAWAHAGELRARYTDGNTSHQNNHNAVLSSISSNKKPKRSPGQVRHHSLRRLKKAQQLAHQLEQVAKQFSQQQPEKMPVMVDSRTVQECQAYASWMRGNWALEMADWKVRK